MSDSGKERTFLPLKSTYLFKISTYSREYAVSDAAHVKKNEEGLAAACSEHPTPPTSKREVTSHARGQIRHICQVPLHTPVQ